MTPTSCSISSCAPRRPLSQASLPEFCGPGTIKQGHPFSPASKTRPVVVRTKLVEARLSVRAGAALPGPRCRPPERSLVSIGTGASRRRAATTSSTARHCRAWRWWRSRWWCRETTPTAQFGPHVPPTSPFIHLLRKKYKQTRKYYMLRFLQAENSKYTMEGQTVAET